MLENTNNNQNDVVEVSSNGESQQEETSLTQAVNTVSALDLLGEAEESEGLTALAGEDDIFATEEEKKELRQQGELEQQQVERQGGGAYDRSYLFHRIVKFGTEDRFSWEKRLSKELIEAGYEQQEVNSADPDQHFVAARGIIIDFRYGFRLAINNGKETFCKTTAMIERKRNGKLLAHRNDNPLKFPIKSAYYATQTKDTDKAKGIDRTRELHWDLRDNPQFDLIATRKVVDEETEEVSYVNRRCADCVANKEYTKDTNTCSASAYLLFCVFELGIQDTEAHRKSPLENPIDVRWVSVQDANLLDYKGDPLNRPFIIRLEGIGASQLSSIGMIENKEIPVILPSHMKAKQRKTCYLPDDNVMSAGDYYKWLNNPRNVEGRVDTSVAGNRLYTTMTEIYITALHRKTATKDFVPVFRPIASGRKTSYNGHTVGDYVKAAVAVYNTEVAIGEGKLPEEAAMPQFNVASNNTKELAAAVVDSKNVAAANGKPAQESTLEAAKKLQAKATVDAFTVPKK